MKILQVIQCDWDIIYIITDNPDWDIKIFQEKYKNETSKIHLWCENPSLGTYRFLWIDYISKIKQYLNYKNILVWEKNNTWMGDLEWDYAPKYEFCIFCNWDGSKKLNWWRDPNIMKFSKTWNDLHPTQKPVDMFSYLIDKSTRQKELVLDCFAWSWTTGVACIEMKRNYILIEKDPDYCKIIEKRLKNTNPPLF